MSNVDKMNMVNMPEIHASNTDMTPRDSRNLLAAAAVIVFLVILGASWGNRLYLGQEAVVDYWPSVTEVSASPASTGGAIEEPSIFFDN